MQPRWVPREPPLAALGLLALGDAAEGVADRLLAEPERLRTLRGLFGPRALFLRGQDLPWAEGVIWLGRDPTATTLWMPTTLRPERAPSLLARALAREVRGSPPFVVVPEGGLVLAAGSADRIDADRLRSWRA